MDSITRADLARDITALQSLPSSTLAHIQQTLAAHATSTTTSSSTSPQPSGLTSPSGPDQGQQTAESLLQNYSTSANDHDSSVRLIRAYLADMRGIQAALPPLHGAVGTSGGQTVLEELGVGLEEVRQKSEEIQRALADVKMPPAPATGPAGRKGSENE